MRGCCQFWPLVMGCVVAGPAGAGTTPWVEFVDETSSRLVADPFVGAQDPEEKDYAWGDVDNDGDIDLVVVRKLPGSNSLGKRNVLFLNENGVLVDRTVEYATDADDGGQGFLDLTPDRDVALVDVDQDGWLDIVTAPSGAFTAGLPKTISHPRIYINKRNDPGGNWLGFRYEEARIPQLVQAPNFTGIGFGDVDGQVDDNAPPDLYFTDALSSLEDRLLVNDGDGNFSDESDTRFAGNTAFLQSLFASHAVIADLNQDGFNDILKVQCILHEIRLAYNDPQNVGFLMQQNSETLYIGGACFVSVADLNNDGLPDIVEADEGSDRYFLNQGNGPDGLANFIPFTFPDSSSGFDNNIVIADLDNDGWKDVLIADVDVDLPSCTASRLDIHHNLGNPPNLTFEEDVGNLPTEPGGPLRGTHDVAVFDLNGDGWNDLVIGTCNGTTVWINHSVTIGFGYPQGLPAAAALDGGTEVQVELTAVGDTLDPESPTLHVSINGGGFNPIAMSDQGGNLFVANLPAGNCLDHLAFYFSAEFNSGSSFTDPPTAPASTFSAVIADGLQVSFRDDIEAGVSGWTVVNDPSLTTGAWEQADPNGTIFSGNQAAPEDDATPGPGNVQAFVTDNGLPGGAGGANDVDGGPTRLISPPVDLDGSDAIISYARWFFSDGLPDDSLTIEVSNNGTTWMVVETVTTTNSAWETASFTVGDYVVPSATVQVRFSTSDDPNNSVTEAGIDDFQVDEFICPSNCPADITDDGVVNVLDLIELLLCLGQLANPPCDAADVNGDGTVNVLDLIELLLVFGQPC